jgi:hypothetical protein
MYSVRRHPAPEHPASYFLKYTQPPITPASKRGAPTPFYIQPEPSVMAAATVDTTAAWSEPAVDKAVFPDGYKTSGMHAPVYSWIQPYEKFPKTISGPTVWFADDFKNNPEKWTHAFTESEIAEIEAAADKFIHDGHPLIGMTKVSLTAY